MSDMLISNDEMLEMFLFEMSSLLEQLDSILLQSEDAGGLTDDNIAEIFRIMHTIKGSSAMMEFHLISTVTHRMEDIFALVRERGIPTELSPQLFDLMLGASDFLKSQLEAIRDGHALAESNQALLDQSVTFLELLRTCATPSCAGGSAPLLPAPSSSDGESILYQIDVLFEEDCGMENLRAVMLITLLRNTCTIIQMTPPDVEINPDTASYILVHGFSVVVRTQSTLQQLQEAVTQAPYIKTSNVTIMTQVPQEDAASSPTPDNAEHFFSAQVHFEEDCGMENLRAFMMLQNLRGSCRILSFSPEDIESNPGSAAVVVENGFHMELATSLDRQELQQQLQESMYVKSVALSFLQESKRPLPALPSSEPLVIEQEQTEQKTEHATTAGKPVKQDLINVSLSKLDELMDLVGELVITESMVIHNPDLKDMAGLESFQKNARRLVKLTDELQDMVMAIRMVPVEGTFHRMHRIVRDMCRSLGKDARLETAGEDTDIDKTIIDTITDPIMHLVRNSMDHGVETPEERIAAGKPPRATITLSAQNTGGEILIVISDDGRGLDVQTLLERAQEKGLLYKPAEEYKDKEAFMLLCAPGFSTRDEVTEYSGRGVGMDVVRQNIEKIGGTVVIESKKGLGMSTLLKIPLTLAIVEGMEVSVADSTFTIPITAINESFKATTEQLIVDTEGNEMILLRGDIYPIVRLSRIYGIDNAVTDIEEGILVWCSSDDRSICLFVDELVGEQQIVVKPLPTYLSRFPVKNFGISGCTILGNGKISLILDVGRIIDSTIEKR